MKCEDARAAISARFDGESVGADPAALEAHLSVCPDCRAEAEAVGFSGELVRTAGAPKPSASFDERVLGGLGRRGWFDRLLDWFEVPARRVAVALALSCLALSCTFFALPSTGFGENRLGIVERQAAQWGFDVPDTDPPHSRRSERSEGGIVPCA